MLAIDLADFRPTTYAKATVADAHDRDYWAAIPPADRILQVVETSQEQCACATGER